MSEKNLLPESGRIDLDNAAQKQNPETKEQESKVETSNLDTQAENKFDSKENSQAAVSKDNSKESTVAYEPDKVRPKVLAVSAIVAGVIIMIAGYVSYRYFSQDSLSEFRNIPVAEVKIDNGEDVDYEGIIDNLNGRITSGVSTSRAEDWQQPGDSFGIVQNNTDIATITGRQEVQGTTSEEPEEIESNLVADTSDGEAISPISTSTQNTRTWIANDYSYGEIDSGSYTVVSGDTLWEISEAVYGNGGDWQKIAQANDISYLSNGNPLILPGQVLNIPA